MDEHASLDELRVLRLTHVKEVTGLSRSSIYKQVKEGTFPKHIPLGDRSIGWLESEVKSWISYRVRLRNLR